MEIRKITGVVKKSAGIWWESEGPWKRPWYKFLLCVCVAWVEKLRTSRFNFAPVPIRLESVGDSRPTLVTAFNLNSQEFNLLDYLWGSANWFHSSSEIFLLDFLSVSLCIAIGAGGKKREKMQEEGRFIFAMQWIFDVEFDCVCWISSSVIFILVMQERERDM